MLSLLFPAVLFGLVYFPTLKYLSVGIVTPYAKVDVWKRLLAAWVDGMPAIAAWFLYRNTESLWGVAVAVLYLLLRDGIGGQSLGSSSSAWSSSMSRPAGCARGRSPRYATCSC